MVSSHHVSSKPTASSDCAWNQAGSASVPSRSSQVASSLQAKRTASAGTGRIATNKVRSSGYASSIPWSEQQKLKQEKLSKQKQVSLPNNTSSLTSLGKEEEVLKRYSRLEAASGHFHIQPDYLCRGFGRWDVGLPLQ